MVENFQQITAGVAAAMIVIAGMAARQDPIEALRYE
jgi:ABC-type antimicrobial peptide transport system permease subunit